MILTTSNITGAIDLAFVDRADIKQYIGNPSPAAIFKIYQSCLNELMRVSNDGQYGLAFFYVSVRNSNFLCRLMVKSIGKFIAFY
jgi:hypothetical protein